MTKKNLNHLLLGSELIEFALLYNPYFISGSKCPPCLQEN